MTATLANNVKWNLIPPLCSSVMEKCCVNDNLDLHLGRLAKLDGQRVL